MASGSAAPNVLPGSSGSSGAGGGGAAPQESGELAGPPLTNDQGTLAGNFGITEEQLTKYDRKTGIFRPPVVRT